MTTASKSKVLRRSMLFMPGDSLRKISKGATEIAVDSIVMDLEDAVAPQRKETARQTVSEALQTLDFGRRERLIRVNSAETGLLMADLEATIAARPDGYVLPKVETAGQVRAVSRFLSQTEQRQGWPARSVRLLAIIETAKGVLNLPQLAPASRRLEALMFGAEDLASDIGARRSRAGWEVFYGRSAVVTAAAAYRLQAIDIVFVDLHDLAGLEEECVFGRQLGYDGKMAIHPAQVPVINRIFAPSPEEIERARRLVEAHQAHEAAGSGTFQFEGQMVDRPVILAAEHILDRARLAGLLEHL